MAPKKNCYKGAAAGGTVVDGDGNLLSNNDCSVQLTTGFNQFSVDPLLIDTVPTDNGGGIETIGISTSSPAIDAGRNPSCTTDDMRSFGRPVDYNNTGLKCDIGPLEMQI